MSKRKQKVNKGTLRRVLELIRPYAGLVVLTLVLAVVTVVTTLLAPVISGKAVDHIIGPGCDSCDTSSATLCSSL